MAKKFKPQIVSANDLLEGDVVYLDANGHWTRGIEEAAVAQTPEAADRLLERADQPARVVGPYLLAVTSGPGGPEPDHFRERFREVGPGLRADFARKARAHAAEQNQSDLGDL